MLVSDLLKELNLEGKYFGILVNGKKADENTEITPKDDITILPHIIFVPNSQLLYFRIFYYSNFILGKRLLIYSM